jgi:mono/diheme cytochrome c family protein
MRPLVLAAALVVATVAAAIGQGAAPKGNAVRGKAIFLRAGVFCGSCHTLRAAASSGRDGPNLDKAKLGYDALVAVITKGRNPSKRWPTGMPHYAGRQAVLTKAQIEDVAAFVYASTHK